MDGVCLAVPRRIRHLTFGLCREIAAHVSRKAEMLCSSHVSPLDIVSSFDEKHHAWQGHSANVIYTHLSCALMGPGESLCCFMIKTITSRMLVPTLQTLILDQYNLQLPEDKDWFRETREARFGMPLERVSILAIPLPGQSLFTVRCVGWSQCSNFKPKLTT